MGWDGTGMNCYGMGWDIKICPMDKPDDNILKCHLEIVIKKHLQNKLDKHKHNRANKNTFISKATALLYFFAFAKQTR